MFWLLHCIDTLLYILYSERMLLAVLYVLGTYMFVSLLLYSMNKEPPPESVDRVNTIDSTKEVKGEHTSKNTIQ